MNPYQELSRQAAEWVREGGAEALERQGRAVAQRKADRSLVTDADHAVQAILLDRISRHCPGDAVITEETLAAPERHASITASRRCWVVDPIDGTRSYSRQFPGFGVSVALLEDGVPVIGLVYSPLTRQLYHAAAGAGAWRDDQRLQVCNDPIGRDTLLAIPSSRRGPMPQPVHRWVDEFVVRNLGSTALHLALLAAGAVDAVFADECKLWDIAAGELLVREAGGRVVSPDGELYFPMKLEHYDQDETPFLAAGSTVLSWFLEDYRKD